MNDIARDFTTLFNVLWYRDFPLEYGVRELGRRAEWTTHIAVCVRSAADLLGYFTHFEAETRTDAVIKDATGTSIANVEWEWTQPKAKGFNELAKLCAAREQVAFSGLVTYSREEHHKENLKTLKQQWGKSEALLLAFLVRYNYRKGRQFGDLETYESRRPFKFYSILFVRWNYGSQGVFGLMQGSLESLVMALSRFDFAVLVLTADDLSVSRGVEKPVARDNILFELGLFVGALGRDRTFMLFDRSKPPALSVGFGWRNCCYL